MTSQEFVIWLKGFTEGVHDFNVTPKQWDVMKDKLDQVKDEPQLTGVPTPIGVPYTPQYPPYTDPFNPYKVTCDDSYPGVLKADRTKYGTSIPIPSDPNITGSVSIPTIWTSTPNNVNFTVTSGSAWSGGGTYTYPNGTTVTYTTGGDMLGVKDFSPSDELNIGGQITDKTLLHD